jgi:hypothetical protein
MTQIVAILAFGVVVTVLSAFLSLRLWQQVRHLTRKYQPMIDVEAQLRLEEQKLEEEKRLQQTVEDAFGADIDYAQLQKIYGAANEFETRYSPATCIGCDMKVVSGNPDPKHVSTSFVERQNLSMRMSIRRFTRLTNAFSKKIENHAAAVALWFTYYNFCRVHSSLRVTPAMESGISDHVWSVEELCNLLPENHKIGVQTNKALVLKALAGTR